MNSLISKYGTLLIIPPILIIIALVACRFHVTTKAEVTLVQTAPTEITAYVPHGVALGDSLHIDSQEYGPMTLPITKIANEPTNQRVTCRGQLPTDDTLLSAAITTATKPLYLVLLHQ